MSDTEKKTTDARTGGNYTADDTVLKIENLNVYYEDHHALRDINLVINRGDYLGIIGPNGGGKTTLLNAILGFVPVASGSIRLFGEKKYSSKHIGYVPSVSLFDRSFPITVGEAVIMGRIKDKIKPFYHYTKEDGLAVDKLLELLGLLDLKERQLSGLSSGEYQKMLLARALVSEPELLLLDEPTANIDAASKEVIYNFLEVMNKKITILLVTHDMLAISSSVKSIACINHTLVYHGAPELTLDLMQTLYGCPVDLIAHGVPHRVLAEHKND